jgi:ubiquinone/menaquinone biosynthesis C-methylase UbiE
MEQAFDPQKYREREREDWNRVAAGWKRWWRTFEQGAQHLSDRMVQLAELEPGQRVLDIGTGIGEPALTAARRVGPTARVVATDISERMLEIARERAAALGLENVDFLEGDAEALDLPNASFDVVLCRWTLMFLPDPAAALRVMWRMLRPDGRLAVAVWGPAEMVPMVTVTMDVLLPALGLSPPPSDQPGMFRYADAGRLVHALRQAGFTDVRVEPVTVTLEWPSAEAYTRLRQDTAAVTVALLSQLTRERRAQVLNDITTAAGSYATPQGTIRMANLSPCGVARRPPR